MTCFCHGPFLFPEGYVLFGCFCGDVWQKGRDRSGAVLWRNQIGVTAQAVPAPRRERKSGDFSGN
jgi:hypothetical protein